MRGLSVSRAEIRLKRPRFRGRSILAWTRLFHAFLRTYPAPIPPHWQHRRPDPWPCPNGATFTSEGQRPGTPDPMHSQPCKGETRSPIPPVQILSRGHCFQPTQDFLDNGRRAVVKSPCPKVPPARLFCRFLCRSRNFTARGSERGKTARAGSSRLDR